MINVTIMSSLKIVFKGQAESVILPGDTGVFEIMSFHKRIMSRLLRGNIVVDGNLFPIARGVVKAERNTVLAIIEEEQN